MTPRNRATYALTQSSRLRDVTITPISSTSLDVILNASTGLITVAANTPASIYDVEYEICETISLGNCSSVVETVTVSTAGGSASFCPAGTNAISGTYHVLSATGGSNPNRAVGAPLAEGSQDTGTSDLESFELTAELVNEYDDGGAFF